MAIDFECPNCLAVLRTASGNAAALGRCPACGGDLRIPEDERPETFERREPPGNTPTAIVVCDLCGSRNVPEDDSCRNCGEELVRDPASAAPARGPRRSYPTSPVPPFTIDEVVSDSWRIYREQFGPCLLGSIISWLAWVAGLIAAFIPIFLFLALFRMGAVRRPGMVLLPFLSLACFIITTYAQVGMMLYIENVVRTGRGDLGLLFRGGRFVPRMLGLNIVYSAVVGVGLVAFVVPGLILYSMFWAAPFILVDRDCGVFQALDRSRRLTHGHRGTLFLVSLIENFVWVVGLALTLVTVATGPFAKLMLTVSYLRLTDQLDEAEDLPTVDDPAGDRRAGTERASEETLEPGMVT